jgi:hypothetical protein
MEVDNLREIIRKELNEFFDFSKKHMDKFGIKTIPLKPEGKKVLKGMKKEGFLDKITNHTIIVYYAYIQNKHANVKEKRMREFIDSWVRNIKGSYDNIYLESKILAYHMSQQVIDMKNNGEEIEPAYYIAKEYFKNFGMGYDRNRVFDGAVTELEGWMKRKGIKA